MRGAAALAASIALLAACEREPARGAGASGSVPDAPPSAAAGIAPPSQGASPASPVSGESVASELGAARLDADGLGPVQIGMTEAEVVQRLGPQASGATGALEDCHFLTLRPSPPTLLFMIENGRLARITVRPGSPVRTAAGLGPGAPAAQVRRAHAEALDREPHKYVDAPAEYLTAWTKPDQAGIRYVVGQDGRVEEIHAGGPAIQYVEGCS